MGFVPELPVGFAARAGVGTCRKEDNHKNNVYGFISPNSCVRVAFTTEILCG